MYPRSEILFPTSCIKGLRTMLDSRWKDLVDDILRLDESSEDSLAFSLMMIRLCGCLNCDMGSYKASLGCEICSQRTILGAKGKSAALLRRYEKARQEIRSYLQHGLVSLEEEDAEQAPAA